MKLELHSLPEALVLLFVCLFVVFCYCLDVIRPGKQIIRGYINWPRKNIGIHHSTGKKCTDCNAIGGGGGGGVSSRGGGGEHCHLGGMEGCPTEISGTSETVN